MGAELGGEDFAVEVFGGWGGEGGDVWWEEMLVRGFDEWVVRMYVQTNVSLIKQAMPMIRLMT